MGQDPSRSSISNVTVKNLKIITCYYAISSENTDNNTFIGNYIVDCDTGFWITGSSNNTLIHNTVKDCVTGISINYGSGGNVIVENNIMNNSFSVWLSPASTVDRNYWSDYLTRYPNAKEIGNSGIGDTPYMYSGNFADNHPQMKEVIIPEFPSWIILPLIIAVTLFIIGIKKYFLSKFRTFPKIVSSSHTLVGDCRNSSKWSKYGT